MSHSTDFDLEGSFTLLQSEIERRNIGRDANQNVPSDQTEDKKRKQPELKKSKKKKSKRSGEDSTIMEISSSSSSSSSESGVVVLPNQEVAS